MKKFCKTLIIISVSIIGIGIILVIGGSISGGFNVIRNGYIDSENIGNGLEQFSKIVSIDNSTGYLQQVKGEDIKTIDIDVDFGNIEIREKESLDDNQIDVISNNNLMYIVEENNNEIRIINNPDYKRGVSFLGINFDFGFSLEEENLRVCLPKDYKLDTSNIYLAAGEITIDGIDMTSLGVESDATNIELANMNITNLNVSTNIGNISGKEIIFDNASVHADTGNIELSCDVLNVLVADCNVGDIEIDLVKKEEKYNVLARCNLGNINIGSFENSGVNGEINLIKGDENPEIQLYSDMGNIEVDFK